MASNLPLLYVGNYQAPTQESQPLIKNTLARQRRAARAVILDPEGGVYIVHAANHGYYKLPGGGMKVGESAETALHREVKEEIGYTVRLGEPIGYTVQYDQSAGFWQESYAYLAYAMQAGTAALEANELEAGFRVVKLPSLEAAHAAVLGGSVANQPPAAGPSMLFRDAAILAAAQKLVTP